LKNSKGKRENGDKGLGSIPSSGQVQGTEKSSASTNKVGSRKDTIRKKQKALGFVSGEGGKI